MSKVTSNFELCYSVSTPLLPALSVKTSKIGPFPSPPAIRSNPPPPYFCSSDRLFQVFTENFYVVPHTVIGFSLHTPPFPIKLQLISFITGFTLIPPITVVAYSLAAFAYCSSSHFSEPAVFLSPSDWSSGNGLSGSLPLYMSISPQ